MLLIAKPETPEQFDEYYNLRWRILRAPWDRLRGAEKDEFDVSADHVTVRDQNGRLLGVGRLHFNTGEEAQIRFMATEEDSRGIGVGRALIERLEELARAQGAERIVLNARDNVLGFYQRFGYSVIGPGPTMFDKVKHSKMEKVLRDDKATSCTS
ncbi:MAG: GNAT family N-acetyltransferase [Gallionella sp.]